MESLVDIEQYLHPFTGEYIFLFILELPKSCVTEVGNGGYRRIQGQGQYYQVNVLLLRKKRKEAFQDRFPQRWQRTPQLNCVNSLRDLGIVVNLVGGGLSLPLLGLIQINIKGTVIVAVISKFLFLPTKHLWIFLILDVQGLWIIRSLNIHFQTNPSSPQGTFINDITHFWPFFGGTPPLITQNHLLK